MRQPPGVFTSSIGPGSGSAPSPVSNTPMSDSEPRMSARMFTETRSGPRVSTNTTRSISSALPASSHALRRRLGEELARRQMPVGGIGGGLEELPQQHVGIHAGRRLGQARRRGPVDGPDRLRRRRTGHPGAAGERHATITHADSDAPATRLTRSLPPVRAPWPSAAALRSRPTGFSGSGLVVTLWPRTSGRVSRKQAPLPGSPHASSRPWCSRASSMLIARPRPVPPERRTRDGSERQNRLNTSFSSPGRSPTP